MSHWKEFQEACYATAKNSGFHEDDSDDPYLQSLQFARRLLLTVSEVIEAFEEHRKGHGLTKIYHVMHSPKEFTGPPHDVTRLPSGGVKVYLGDNIIPRFLTNQEYEDWLLATGWTRKPEGVPIELADAVIRLGNLAESLGIDLGAAIEEKMQFNKTREYKHGKAC